MSPRRGLGQFGVDANAIASAANAAFEQVAHIEQAPDFGRRQVSVLELKARRFGDDEQVREATEGGDDVLGDPVTKEILAGVARQVLEGQHRHRRASGETRRRSEARDFDRLGRSARTRAALGPHPHEAPIQQGRPRRVQPRPQPPLRGSPPLSWPDCGGRDAYSVGTDRLGDILDAMAAERMVIEIELVS